VAGARSARQKLAVEDLLAAMHVLPLGREAARRAGVLHLELGQRGQEIGMADCLIAGICLEENAILLTRNRRHFERVDGLKLSMGADDGAH